MTQTYKTDCPLTRHVLRQCPRMSSSFTPVLWARNAHVQTFLGTLLNRDQKYIREIFNLKDGGIVALDWARGDFDQNCPILFVIPGLTGDATSVGHQCKLAIHRGFRPVVFNKRGHGNSVIITPKLQSFGDPSDFREVVIHVTSKYPQSVRCAVAYSAGTGLLVSYLGEYSSDCLLQAAVCVSPGYKSEFLLKSCIKGPYNYLLLRGLKQLVTAHSTTLSKALDVDKALNTSRIIDFEEEVYCKLYGYDSLEEYLQKNNPTRAVDRVTIPVLCISSLDDPVCRKECIDYSLFNDRPNFMLVTTTKGGHCGFLEGKSLERWADNMTLDYLEAVMSFKGEDNDDVDEDVKDTEESGES